MNEGALMKDNEPYPYDLHTNCELKLMLEGKKPFAVFSHDRVDGFEKSDALAGQDFESYVTKGLISECVRSFQGNKQDGSSYDIDYYFYALEGEQWRVEAYCLLLEMLHNYTWSPELEWLQGKLLGYTDEQNKYHLARIYGSGSTES